MQKFRHELYGYNKDDVKYFVNNVILETEDIVNRCRKQNEEIIYLKKIIKQYKDIEYNLKISLIRANKESNDIKNNALKEKEEIINKAKKDASIIVNDALLRTKQLEKNIEKIKKDLRNTVYKDIENITNDILL